MSSQVVAVSAFIALLGAGLASADGTRSFSAVPALQTIQAEDAVGSAGKQCREEVVRNGTPGTASITRLAEADGACVCTVTTGPAQGNGQAEEMVSTLLQNRTCDGAPAPSNQPAAFAPGAGLWALLAVPVGAAGVGAAAGQGGDSPG